jgi:hypothetical protein
VQRGIRFALFRKYLRIQRRFGREVLEQQPFRNRGRRRDTFGRGARKAMAGKAALGCGQDQLPPKIAGHAQGAHPRE